MKYKQYKIATGLYANMPVDPEIERFIGARINEKLEMAMGIPQSQQLQGKLSLRDLIQDDTRIFIINIDDALSTFRQLIAAGFKVKRGITAMGNRGNYFYVYSLSRVPVVMTTVLIDIWRHTPRGQMLSAPLKTRGLSWERR